MNLPFPPDQANWKYFLHLLVCIHTWATNIPNWSNIISPPPSPSTHTHTQVCSFNLRETENKRFVPFFSFKYIETICLALTLREPSRVLYTFCLDKEPLGGSKRQRITYILSIFWERTAAKASLPFVFKFIPAPMKYLQYWSEITFPLQITHNYKLRPKMVSRNATHRHKN